MKYFIEFISLMESLSWTVGWFHLFHFSIKHLLEIPFALFSLTRVRWILVMLSVLVFRIWHCAADVHCFSFQLALRRFLIRRSVFLHSFSSLSAVYVPQIITRPTAIIATDRTTPVTVSDAVAAMPYSSSVAPHVLIIFLFMFLSYSGISLNATVICNPNSSAIR